jgi:16S rRNA (uracil1498-N3)-methyltransferase
MQQLRASLLVAVSVAIISVTAWQTPQQLVPRTPYRSSVPITLCRASGAADSADAERRTPGLRVHVLPGKVRLQAGDTLPLMSRTLHQVAKVRRSRNGSALRVFNEMDGEWLAIITDIKVGLVRVDSQVRRPSSRSLVGTLLFCPPKSRERFRFVVEKATELGVASLQPVATVYTQLDRREDTARIRAAGLWAHDAMVQCEALSTPALLTVLPLQTAIAQESKSLRRVLVCTEPRHNTSDKGRRTVPLLRALRDADADDWTVSLLVGPEGGFSEEEVTAVLQAGGRAVSIGTSILRAETCCIAALAIWRAHIDDTISEKRHRLL